MSSPHEGGSLSEMAQEGTSMPNDAGQMNTLPSISGPSDSLDSATPDLASAATNANDISRITADKSAPTEAVTGTGDALPASIGTKNLTTGGGDPRAKGHPRYEKHVKQHDTEFWGGSGGPGVEVAPGQEDESEEALRSKRDGVE
jgi:hypothetical protein